ncbi:MAG: hypothetical protein INR69_15150 [Mucilaginibacter polytrichastri]|nr:hypothetical protein [Mucilaginibacter polytrichastri]
MNAKWTTDELEKLRTLMPDGWKSSLAEEFGLSVGRIGNIMRGQKPIDSVVLRAIDMANEHQLNLKTAKQALAAL